ncbi:MAG: hypothetical protein AB8H80_09470 [Planctomycetota bacterium]
MGPPQGPARAVFVDGILDGRTADEAALHEAVDAAGTAGVGAFQLDLQGGRFSVLPATTRRTGRAAQSFDVAAQANLLDRLQGIVEAAEAGSVETTLHCKLIYDAEVTETLFVLRDGQLEAVTRRRPSSERDEADVRAAAAPVATSNRRMWLIAPLLLVSAVILLWQLGVVDQLFSPAAENLHLEAGPFEALVEIEAVERTALGGYLLKLQRGASYPATPAALEQGRASASTTAERVAWDVLDGRGPLYVQLRDIDGQTIYESRISLRNLLLDPDHSQAIRLPGHRSAAVIALALASGYRLPGLPR